MKIESSEMKIEETGSVKESRLSSENMTGSGGQALSKKSSANSRAMYPKKRPSSSNHQSNLNVGTANDQSRKIVNDHH
jgi:hypothetical protein